MVDPKIGVQASDFCLPEGDGKSVSLKGVLKEGKGKWVILYFYPKDETTGCTVEAISFSKALGDFNKFEAKVIGISPDSGESHCKFIENHKLKIILLSDAAKKVIKAYGAYGKKNLYGKEVEGVIRTTFLMDPSGEIAYVWRNVKAEGHAEEVLDKLRELHGM